jgi:hypothetical protein
LTVSPALRVSPMVSRLRPRVVSRPVVPGRAPVPAVAQSAPLARLSAAAGQQVQPAQRPAESEASAQPGLALRLEEPEVRDAAAVPEAARGAAEVRLQAAELPGAAVGPQQVVRDGEAGRQPEELAVQDAAAGQPAAAQDAEVRQREAPVGPAVGLPSAAAWVFRRDQVLPWPEP